MKTTEIKEKFLQLRAEGYSFQAISDQLEVSKQTLINWSKDIHVQAELQNIKTVRMESLYEHFVRKNYQNFACLDKESGDGS